MRPAVFNGQYIDAAGHYFDPVGDQFRQLRHDLGEGGLSWTVRIDTLRAWF